MRLKFVIYLFVLLIFSPLLAKQAGGVSFPREVILADGMSLSLKGAGLMRYKLVFKGYSAALYLPKGYKGDALADVPRQITFHYFWDIKGNAFADSANEWLKKNNSAAEMRKVKDAISQFHKLYVNISKGERFELTYVPGIGTQLRHKGKLLGTVPGADFARAYFGIWLGKKPISAALKKKLLGKR